MRQRVALARAFANDPDVLLMDEPFSALDEQTKTLLQQELLRIWADTGKTVVFITHSVDEAVTLGDRILVMTGRPGRAKAVFDVPFERPRDVLELRKRPAYGELVYAIWDSLREEVTA
jgi:NitT/TauT family transport system ATP-binding protein